MAYSHLALTEHHPHDFDACEDAGHLFAFAYRGFEASTRGLADHDRPVNLGQTKCIGGRCYLPTDATDRYEICDLSYRSFGAWRRDLSQAALGVAPETVWAAPTVWASRPFFEVINFADNEGTIGPEAAADLLADFQEYAHLQDASPDPEWGTWWEKLWGRWTEGLALASQGGLVRYS